MVLLAGAGFALASAGHAVDSDSDRRDDAQDNCPYTFNPRQEDRGAVGSVTPNGTGDICECGDVNGDGASRLNDLTIIRRAMVGLAPGLAHPEKCNVVGPADPRDDNGDGVPNDCGLDDVVVLTRAFLGLAPGVGPVCEPALALRLTIDDPAEGAVVGTTPILVRGSVTDPFARVAVGNRLGAVTGSAYEVVGIPVVEGSNSVTVRSINDRGGQAQATVHVTLDTTPPSIGFGAPGERSLLSAGPASVAATVSDASAVSCTVNGSSGTVSAGTLSGEAALAEGPNLVSLVCTDAAGNSTTVERTVFFDPDPLFVIGVDPPDQAVGVQRTRSVTITFSEPVKPLTVLPTTLSLLAGAFLIPTAISVSADGHEATLTPQGDLPGGATVEVAVSAGITDTSGSPLAVPFTSHFVTEGAPGGVGLVLGEVYDDRRSLPLAGATVEALGAMNGQPLGSTTTDVRGRYHFDSLPVGTVLRITAPDFTAPDFTASDRVVTGFENGLSEVLDARLTRREPGKSVAALIGGELTDRAGNRLSIPPGRLRGDAAVAVTAVSGQGPRGLFPTGWTPLGIVEIEGLEGMAGGSTLTVADGTGAPPGSGVLFARYDEAALQWIALAGASLADGKAELQGISQSGQYALLRRDTGEGAPEMPAPGQALPAAAAIGIPGGGFGSGSVTPPVGLASDPTPAHALVRIFADVPLRSGTLLRGDFVEFFLLRDGGEATPLNTSQDLFGYRDPADPEDRTLASAFPIAPSRIFDLSELATGTITVELVRGMRAARSLLGVAGGGVEAEGGGRVLVGPGAFSEPVPIEIRRMDAAALPDLGSQGLTALGGLELDLAGAEAAAPLTLALEGVASQVPTGSTVVVAELRELGGHERPVFVALARLAGDGLTTLTDVPDLPGLPSISLPGPRHGGRYAFYRYDGPLVVLASTAREEEGRPDGHVIELEAFPFVSVSGETGSDATGGRFALVSRPGPFELLATGATAGDELEVAGDTVAGLDPLVIQPTPPKVELLVVRPPKLEGNFAGPVVLVGSPPPIIDDDALGESQGDGDGTIEAGERIELSLSVRNDATVPVQGGVLALRVEGPTGAIPVTPASVEIGSLSPDDPTEFGPFVFEAPQGTDPTTYRYTLAHLNEGGLANSISFGLPLEAQHLDVSTQSEIVARFSEPVTRLENAFYVERRNGSGLFEPVTTRLIVSEGGAVATLRPSAALADDTIYRITLTGAIVDRNDRHLTPAPVVETLRTEDRTPPGPIAPGQIEASVPDDGGMVHITATLGTVNPTDSVILLNETTGLATLATVVEDGSFQGGLRAEQNDQLSIILRDPGGNETKIPVRELVRRDPITHRVVSMVLGAAGGSFESADGVTLIVPAGALAGATELSASRTHDPFALPDDISADPGLSVAFAAAFAVHDRIRITASTSRFLAPIDVGLQAPAGSQAGDGFLLIARHTVQIGGPRADFDLVTGLSLEQNPRRTVDRLAVVESMSVKNEAGALTLSTDSPPFPGVLEPGAFTILEPRKVLVFLSGEIRRDTPNGQPVPGAVVRSAFGDPGLEPFATTTDRRGHFVIPDALGSGPFSQGDILSSRLDVVDSGFQRVVRKDVRGSVISGPPSEVVATLIEPFVLPRKLPSAFVPILGDVEPPEVKIKLEGPSLLDNISLVADPVTVTVLATDDDEVVFLSLSLDDGSGIAEVALDQQGRFEFTPTQPGVVTFQAEARDTKSVTLTRAVALIVDAAGFAPLAGPPRLIITTEEAPVFTGTLTKRFSEPLDPATVNDTTVTLLDPERNRVDIKISLEETDTLVRIRPFRNLRLGVTYTLETSAGVLDSTGESFDGSISAFRVAPPVLRSVIALANSEDVALLGDRLAVINHPTGFSTADLGALHVYDVFDSSIKSSLLEEPALVSSTRVLGRPLSLAVDGDRVFVGNRFLGPIATKEPFVSSVPAGSTDVAGALLGCDVSIAGTSICSRLSLVWNTFPRPASNVEIFDLSNPANPSRLEAHPLNFVPPGLWNPNTWPDRLDVTDHGVAVLNFLNNVELFSRSLDFGSRGVVGRIQGYAETIGRCSGGPRVGQLCTEIPQVVGLPPINECLPGSCDAVTEFLDVAYVGDFAFALEANGLRVLSMTAIADPLVLDPTVNFLPFPGSHGGRIGAIPQFEWTDVTGAPRTADLVLVTRPSLGLLILDVSNPLSPSVLSDSLRASGNISFDRERGIAFIHGPNCAVFLVDFNDPERPVDLNDPDPGQERFTVGGIGSKITMNGNANRDGVVYLSGDRGVAVVDTRPHGDLEHQALPCEDIKPTVRVEKIYSDQFAGIDANFLPGGAGEDSNTGRFILMGARNEMNETNTARVRVRLRAEGLPVRGAPAARLARINNHGRCGGVVPPAVELQAVAAPIQRF